MQRAVAEKGLSLQQAVGHWSEVEGGYTFGEASNSYLGESRSMIAATADFLLSWYADDVVSGIDAPVQNRIWNTPAYRMKSLLASFFDPMPDATLGVAGGRLDFRLALPDARFIGLWRSPGRGFCTRPAQRRDRRT